ncbi:MCE family protein [Saccharibacter sp. 17.LH.SD]|uniref:MlaD family protein n=1 Tax=Saccharibacter sp. 17.LH.SD TaxID=2689393 RepID=UPI00136F7FC7|nr:MlaD family protein [Saccharibacter sp. 17.LH.SD]MXV44561.1 MCE family protein [Saccharibacter sp. 17.LH.SD]
MHAIIKGRGGAFLASACVLVLSAAFIIYGYALNHGPLGDRTVFHASFSSANGLAAGSDVDLGGVTVGRVRSITLNSDIAVADVAFDVESQLVLPSDTAVSIAAPTVGGDDALFLEPGHSRTPLKPGSTILNAHPLLSLEQQISNYIFGAGNL